MAKIQSNLIPALTIALEARNQPDQGQVAVGDVLRNRAARTGQGIDAEAMRPKAFSGWNNLSVEKAQNIISPEDFQRAAKNWQAAQDDPSPLPATHYFNPKIANPKWDFTKMQNLGAIGDHQFYNEPGWNPGRALKNLQK